MWVMVYCVAADDSSYDTKAMTKRSMPQVADRENLHRLRGVQKDGSRKSLPSRSTE